VIQLDIVINDVELEHVEHVAAYIELAASKHAGPGDV
jgi:hypothetical protein